MSVSLSYRSCLPVNAAAKAAIVQEAGRLNSEREWWCEGINFFDHPEYRGLLSGDTKLFLVGYSTSDGGYVEVDADDDCFMAAREVVFLVETLADWSRKYKVNWLLACEGGTVGDIKDGVATPSIQEVAESLASGIELLPTSEAGERAKQISERYASRW